MVAEMRGKRPLGRQDGRASRKVMKDIKGSTTRNSDKYSVW